MSKDNRLEVVEVAGDIVRVVFNKKEFVIQQPPATGETLLEKMEKYKHADYDALIQDVAEDRRLDYEEDYLEVVNIIDDEVNAGREKVAMVAAREESDGRHEQAVQVLSKHETTAASIAAWRANRQSRNDEKSSAPADADDDKPGRWPVLEAMREAGRSQAQIPGERKDRGRGR